MSPLDRILGRRPRRRGLPWLLAAWSLLLLGAPVARASVSFNTGSLGSAANGTNADTVTFDTGVVMNGTDQTAVYDGVSGTNTVVPFQAALNPAAGSPFPIEFWAKPAGSDNDDAPVSNRIASGNRSGWVFFQRAPGTGWNFRMYNGNGSGLGWDLTGGGSALDTWNHVVATWDGSKALLYENGQLVDDTNDPAASGVYNAATTSHNLIVASSDTGSPYHGAADEVAFYNKVLSASDIQKHYDTGTGTLAGDYQALVRTDGALLQLSNNEVPEPAAIAIVAMGLVVVCRRRRA